MSNIWDAYEKERMENTGFCSYADGWCASCKRKYEEEEEERAKPWQQVKQEAIEEIAFKFYFFDKLKNQNVDCSRANAKDSWSEETYDEKLYWKDLAVGHVCHGRTSGWEALRRNERKPDHLVDACERCAQAFSRAEAKEEAETAAAAKRAAEATAGKASSSKGKGKF